MRAEQEEEFRGFAAAAIPGLHRLALAVSRDPHTADDLVQQTLEKVYVAWPRLDHVQSPQAYARTIRVRSLVDEKRRWWSRKVTVTDRPPDRGIADARIEGLGAGDEVMAALAALTPRQRAAVALRHLDGPSVSEAAAAVGTSEANVKAATREGLAALRIALSPTETHIPDEQAREECVR
ncbi:sigma-70 family RNA polymerase sigma factor [Actinomycetota bacterium]